MGDLFNITHEAGNLSEYSSTVIDGGDLSAAAAAALAGTGYGLQCVIDDTTAIYGLTSISAPASQLRYRFYIDPNSLSMGSGENFVCSAIYGTHATVSLVAGCHLGWDGSSFEIRAFCFDDGNAFRGTSFYNISDGAHYVEVHLTRASAASANDGSISLYIDGALQQTVSAIDTYDAFNLISSMRLGAIVGIDAGTSGTLYLDEFKANDDGGEIGAVASGQPAVIRGILIPGMNRVYPGRIGF